MPPDEDELDYIRNGQTREIARLRVENNQLRNLLVTLLRVMKEVENNLQIALDKDLTKTDDRTT
jgi:hemerythrin-like domain-containing protein